MRVVLAIPSAELSNGPALLEGGRRKSEEWSAPQEWGWVLATAADQSVEAIPRETVRRAEAASCGEYRNWTLWASEFGLAVVCHDSALTRRGVDGNVSIPAPNGPMQAPFIGLAQTRYVDLAILTLRSYSILGNLSLELAEADRSHGADSGASAAGEVNSEYGLPQLRKRLKRLQEIESDYVRFRDRLWFDSVPKHQIDTRIMVNLREHCGVARLHDSFLGELQLRRDVSSTRHAELEVAEAQRREEQASRDRVRRQAEQEERETTREHLNQLLAVLAIIFAVPGIVDAFSPEKSWRIGLLVVGLMLFLGFVAYKAVAGWNRRTLRSARSSSPGPDAEQAPTSANGRR